jgi:hypothetical protein
MKLEFGDRVMVADKLSKHHANPPSYDEKRWKAHALRAPQSAIFLGYRTLVNVRVTEVPYRSGRSTRTSFVPLDSLRAALVCVNGSTNPFYASTATMTYLNKSGATV